MTTASEREEQIQVLQECIDKKWKRPFFLKFMRKADDCRACVKYRACQGCPISMAGFNKCYKTPVMREPLPRTILWIYEFSRLSPLKWWRMVRDEKRFLRALIKHLEARRPLGTFKLCTGYDWRKDL